MATYSMLDVSDRRLLAKRVWAGYGNGTACDFCDVPITETDVELEVTLAMGSLRFHRACLKLWESIQED